MTYVTVALDELLRPLVGAASIVRPVTRVLGALERRITPSFFQFLHGLGWVTVLSEPDEHTMLAQRTLYEEGKQRGIKVEEVRLFGTPHNVFLATMPDGKVIAYEGIPLPGVMRDQAPWMDNKAAMKKHFRRAGFPIARGAAAMTLGKARNIFSQLDSPVIVKPYAGSGSRHTTLHVQNEAELTRAFTVATQVAPVALVEEELQGDVYRATCVNGTLVATLRRDPPTVVGDGIHTVTERIEEENKHPKRQGPYFGPITLNADAVKELRYQNLLPDSIPAIGQRVRLHQKINWSVGGTTTDVTDEVHPETRALFEEAAQMLCAPIVGFDFIIEDIARSWKEQSRCGFIEANSMPFFDNHHLPFSGKPRNVAALIWDLNT